MKCIVKRIFIMLLSISIVLSVPLDVVLMNVNAASYVVNGVTVYADRNDWQGSAGCWNYALLQYKRVWNGATFNSYRGTNDDMLRNLNTDELTLTPEHLKSYVSAAPLGSVIRICNSGYLSGGDGWGHSVFLVSKDSTGFTVLENWASGVYEHYYNWSNFRTKEPADNAGTLYDYIKYIKYPNATPYNPISYYTVWLNANGGEVNPGSITVQSGGTYSGLPTPSRSGYDFAGWFDDGGRQVWDGLGIYTNGDHTLYAHWNPHKHNVWLNANGGEVNPGVIEVFTDGVYSGLPTPGRYGYDFAGWFDDSGRQVWDGLGIYTNAEHTLYAHWNPKSVKVNLNANGGSVSHDSIQVNFDNKYNNLPSAERTGYNFNGWFTAPDEGTQVDFNSVCNTVDEHTLYAHWSKDKYMITFNAMGGSVESANKLVTYDNKYGVFPTPEKKGYRFAGWYLDESCTNEITSSSIVKITANQDIYAKWELRKYYITFDANGGSVDITNKQVTAEKKYGVLPTPEKTNSRFVGWFTDENIQISSSSIVELESDTTLYAKWILIGDVNLDEEINVADAVRLQKYLLGQEKISYNEYLAGDINEDGSADVFDMVCMRKIIIER